MAEKKFAADSEQLEKCKKEIQERLEKYDIVVDEENTTFGEFLKNQNGQLEESVFPSNNKPKILKEIVDRISDFEGDASASHFKKYGLMTNGTFYHIYNNNTHPKEIQELFWGFLYKMKMFEGSSKQVYIMDVLRAIAYHNYVKKFSSNNLEIRDIITWEPKEFLNIPIDLLVNIDKKKYAVLPSIGGGMLGYAVLSGKEKNVFLRKKDRSGADKMREKGINFDLLKQLVEQITRNPITAADAWFIKNTLDPELTVGLCWAIEGTNKREWPDSKFIEIICKCVCPSVRLYVFEAVRPCYFYIRNNLPKRIDLMELLLRELESYILQINDYFYYLIIEVDTFLKHYGMSCEEVIGASDNLRKRFERGDDFPFVLGEHTERNSSIKAYYYDYIKDEKGDLRGKVAYDVITDLHNAWDEEKKERLKKLARIDMRTYETRLDDHIQNMFYQ